MATTCNIIPRVTCFDIRAGLNASPLGTTVCIDFSTLIGRLMFYSTGDICTCDVVNLPIPTLEPSFDHEYISCDPVLRVVAYRLRNFSSHVVVDRDSSCTKLTFFGVKHVDSLTLRELLCEGASRIRFEADCLDGTFTICMMHDKRDVEICNENLMSSQREAVRQIYEVTKRYLQRKRKSVAKHLPLLPSPLKKCRSNRKRNADSKT